MAGLGTSRGRRSIAATTAVPSMHIGYSVIVGAALVRHGRSRWSSVAGVLYPLFVLLVIVATGNHFFFDAAMGVVVAGAAAVLTAICLRNSAQAEVVSLDAIRRARPSASEERRAA